MLFRSLGVMAETCNRVAVMYAGSVVEIGPVRSVLRSPQHPYTQGLLKTIPNDVPPDQPLLSIRGQVPSLLQPIAACPFAARYDRVEERCRKEMPPSYALGGDRHVACFLHQGSLALTERH